MERTIRRLFSASRLSCERSTNFPCLWIRKLSYWREARHCFQRNLLVAEPGFEPGFSGLWDQAGTTPVHSAILSSKWDSNPQPSPWQGDYLTNWYITASGAVEEIRTLNFQRGRLTLYHWVTTANCRSGETRTPKIMVLSHTRLPVASRTHVNKKEKLKKSEFSKSA